MSGPDSRGRPAPPPAPAPMPAAAGRIRWLLCFGAVLYFFVNMQRVAVPGAVFAPLQGELGVSAPYITALGSAFMYVYAAAQLPAGFLVNRYGGRRVIAWGAALFCLGSLAFPAARSLAGLYASRALTGLGAGAVYLGLERETHRAFDRNYSLALSVVIMTGYSGGIAANAPFTAWTEAAGFRSALGWLGAAAGVAYLCFLAIHASLPAAGPQATPSPLGSFRSVLRRRGNLCAFAFGGLNFGLYYVLQTVIGKKFLEDRAGFSSMAAAWVLSGMGAISACSGLFFALLSRWSGHRRSVFFRAAGISGAVSFVSLTALAASDAGGCVYAALFCGLSLTSSLSCLLLPLLRETNEPETAGVAVGVMNFSFYLAVAVFGNAVGALMNLFPPTARGGALAYGRESYMAVFAGLAVFAMLSAACAFALRDSGGKPRAHPS